MQNYASLYRTAFTLALAATAAAQLPVHQTIPATESTSWWGKNAVGLGDQDGDGVRDYAVATTKYNSNAADRIDYYSGATGQLIRVLAQLGTNDNFGEAMAAAGDVDGDGIEDLLVGSPGNDAGGNAAGAAHLYSGADGSVLWSTLGTANLHAMGRALAGLGDIDGDSVPDYAVTASGETVQPNWGGIVHVYSGATGTELYWIGNGATTTDPAESYGDALVAAGDMNGDGVRDLLIGAPHRHVSGFGRVGAVEIRSGVDGALLGELYEPNGMEFNAGYGASIAGDVDVNGDGVPEILIGSPGYRMNGADGSLNLIDGATGATIAQHLGDTTGPGAFGYHVAFFGDVNGDGFDDYGAAYDYTGTIGYSGYVRIYSGADHTLLEEFDAPGGAAGFGSSLCALGDVTGDRLPDLFVGARYEGEGYVMSVAGARQFGVLPAEATQTLELTWQPDNGVDPARGAFQMTGAAANAPAWFGVAGGSAMGSLFGMTIWLDPLTPEFVLAPIAVDAAGTYLSPTTTLRQPALDGVSLFCQILAIDLSAPELLVSSAGLEVRLTN